MHSPLTTRIEATLLQNCKDRHEFEHISLDGTLRVIRKVVGQADYRAETAVRNAAPLPDRVAHRKVLTVVGRSGSTVKCVSHMPDNNSDKCDPASSLPTTLMSST